MEEKCTKYEALFTFGSEEDLLEHIKSCPDCKTEHEKMRKVSNLIQEAKPYFIKKHQYITKLRAICAIFVMCVCVSTLCAVNLNPDISDTILYGSPLSAEDLGFPVDSYGLLMVE